MISVQLYNLSFYAFHGIYAGETKTGNNYEVNLVVKYNEKKIAMNDLQHMVNYEELFVIVKNRMAIPTPLLEEVAEGIINSVKHRYLFVDEVAVSVYKIQPPIKGFQGKIGITVEKKFES